MSTDGGKSWKDLDGWLGANEIIPLSSNGTFVTLPYRVNVNYATNQSAESVNGFARIDASGNYTHSKAADFKMEFFTGESSPARWPYILVHSGSVVKLKDGSFLTTMYGHGAGTYRKW
jgi:hypothetical protein